MTDQTDDPQVTDEQRVAFLAYVTDHPDCSVREACDAVGVKRYTIRQLKAADPDFAEDYREARGYGNAAIRHALASRAIVGVEEPIVNAKGEVVGTRYVTSDRLLEFLARMHLPEAKALQAHRVGLEVTGKDGGPVEIEDRSASLADVARVLEAVGALAQLGGGSPRLALPAPPDVLAEPQEG